MFWLIVGRVLGHDDLGTAADGGGAGDRAAPAALVEGLVLELADVGHAADQPLFAAILLAARGQAGRRLARGRLAPGGLAASRGSTRIWALAPPSLEHADRISIRMARIATHELVCFRI